MFCFLGGFFVKYFSLKFEHSVIFSHWKLGSLSLLGDEKRGSNHLSIVNLPLPSISKANKQLQGYISLFFLKRLVSDFCVWKFLVNMLWNYEYMEKKDLGKWWKGKWKWKCFPVHCVTVGECFVSGATGAWGNHWSMVGLGEAGAIGYANEKEIVIGNKTNKSLKFFIYITITSIYERCLANGKEIAICKESPNEKDTNQI